MTKVQISPNNHPAFSLMKITDEEDRHGGWLEFMDRVFRSLGATDHRDGFANCTDVVVRGESPYRFGRILQDMVGQFDGYIVRYEPGNIYLCITDGSRKVALYDPSKRAPDEIPGGVAIEHAPSDNPWFVAADHLNNEPYARHNPPTL